MDKLVMELLTLLRELLAAHQRLLRLSQMRQEAMRTFDVQRLNDLLEREKAETQRLETIEKLRRILVEQMKLQLGRNTPATISAIAQRVAEPQRSTLLGLAAQVKATVEQLDRSQRINAKVSETVVKSLAKVLKIVTGLAQHAGLYMRDGRKAALRGVHTLEVTA